MVANIVEKTELYTKFSLSISESDNITTYYLFINSELKQEIEFINYKCELVLDNLKNMDMVEIKVECNGSYNTVYRCYHDFRNFKKLYEPIFLKTNKYEYYIEPMYLTTSFEGVVPQEVKKFGGINLSLDFFNDYSNGFDEGFILGQML